MSSQDWNFFSWLMKLVKKTIEKKQLNHRIEKKNNYKHNRILKSNKKLKWVTI